MYLKGEDGGTPLLLAAKTTRHDDTQEIDINAVRAEIKKANSKRGKSLFSKSR